MWAFLHRRKITSSQIILVGFALVILLGTALLMLPVSSQSGAATAFGDCLFTATSAVCVTGLVVLDTATHWSFFGQAVILLLIQIGGMGVITVAAIITMVSGKKISLMQRSTMCDAVSAPQMGGIARFTGFLVRGIFCFELLGALVLMTVFLPEFGPKGIWLSLFHSVSAFCNAGFDLMGGFASLTAYAANPMVNLTIMALVLTGGIGFLTWQDIRQNHYHLRQYRMQSKVILTMTVVLIALPAAYFFFFELSALPLPRRIWGSLFQAVTPRTAGFNTLDIAAFSEAGQLITALLMLIGGAPGSTAGGMKTTTLAVLIACAAAAFRKRENGAFFGRRISDEAVKNAAAVLLLYLGMFLTGGIIISRAENLPLLTALFESASAVGTVGLTLGITPTLGTVSRLVLILLMFFGRVGGMTFVFATLPAKQNPHSRLPLEKIAVG